MLLISAFFIIYNDHLFFHLQIWSLPLVLKVRHFVIIISQLPPSIWFWQGPESGRFLASGFWRWPLPSLATPRVTPEKQNSLSSESSSQAKSVSDGWVAEQDQQQSHFRVKGDCLSLHRISFFTPSVFNATLTDNLNC